MSSIAAKSAPTTFRLHTPVPRAGDPHRLNLFPGRALSQHAFTQLQGYLDERIAPLLASLGPGIVEGLDATTLDATPDGPGPDSRVHVQPGLAVGAEGKLVRLFSALDLAWPDLVELAERDQDGPLRDGLYFLTLRSAVESIDNGEDRPAASRDEPDPTRERRLETVALASLQHVSSAARLLAMPRTRAANQVAARLLQASPFQPGTGAVPLGLFKVVGRRPVWFDGQAGRLVAEPDAAERALLAHTIGVLDDWQRAQAKAPPPAEDSVQANPASRSLAEQFGLDTLPAAGPLPATLLSEPAARQPRLNFRPDGLCIELVPVPASTVASVIAAELPRGTVDLVHGQGERLRLLLAIPDLEHRPDLLDWPQRDLALEDQLFRRTWQAQRTHAQWRQQWQALFQGLSAAQRAAWQAPNGSLPAPADPDGFRTRLVDRRRAALGTAAPLPEPYRSHLSAPHPPPQDESPPVPLPAPDGPSLFAQREALRSEIRRLESVLDRGYRLLNEVNDFLGLQRQQFDALTVTFSTLAGGVPGDGLGASLARWTTRAELVPNQQRTSP